MEAFECLRCHVVYPKSNFYARNDRGGIGITRICKACNRKKSRDYKIKNKDKFVEPLSDGSKTCWKCKVDQHVSRFGKCRSYADGLNPQCKQCARKYAKEIGNPRQRENDPSGRKSNLWHKYRLSHGQYSELVESQGRKCPICDEEFKRTPHVDHCHETGIVRGILCHRCNTWLGILEQQWFVDKANAYLASRTGGES